jgi:cyanoexosortase B-associated protein
MSEAAKPITKQKSLLQWALVVLLAAIVAIAALPSYVNGQWPWQAPLGVPQIGQLRALMQTPPTLEGWETLHHQEVNISGQSWQIAEYQPTATNATTITSAALLLRPQMSADQQPGVEWVDIIGSQGWQVDDRQTLRFKVLPPNGRAVYVRTHYFRVLRDNTTFAVMQWYAWPTGGHYAPGKWFWADQGRQWRRRERMPWVALTVLFPIEPLGDIRSHADQAIPLGQAIQTTLLASTFADG